MTPQPDRDVMANLAHSTDDFRAIIAMDPELAADAHARATAEIRRLEAEVERLAATNRGAVEENERLRAVIRDMKSLMPIVRQHAEQVTEWADASLDPPGGR